MDLLLLPTSLSVRQEIRRRLAQSSKGVITTHGIMSIAAFEEQILRDLHIEDPISSIGQSLLIQDILMEYQATHKDGKFHKISEKPGFIRLLAHWIKEMKIALVLPENLQSTIDLGEQRFRDLHYLYKTYQRSLDRAGLVDDEDRRIALIKALEEGPHSLPFLNRISSLELRGIFTFSPFRFQLLVLLGRLFPVRIVFPLLLNHQNRFNAIKRSYKKFKALEGQEKGIELVCEKGWIPDMEALCRITEGVELLEAPSRYREIEEVGHRIVELTDRGVQPGQIALIWRDLSKEGPLVQDVFQRYRIPFIFRRGIPLSSTPLASIIFSLFRAIDSGYDRDTVLQLVKNRYISDLLQWEVNEDLLEQILLDAKIMDGPVSYWQEHLNAFIQSSAKTKTKGELDLLEGLEERMGSLLTKMESIARSRRCPELIDHLFEFLGDLSPLRLLDPGEDLWVSRREYLALQALKGVLSSLKKEADRLGDRKGIKYRHLIHAIIETLHSTILPPIFEHEENAIHVLKLDDCVGLAYDYVFIGGLEEGKFPLRPPFDPLWRDKDKILFNRAYCDKILGHCPPLQPGRRPFQTTFEKWEEESMLFYTALGLAKKGVTLSYSRSDLEGRPLLQSQYIREVQETANAPLALDKAPFLQVERDYCFCHDLVELRNKLGKDLFLKREWNEEDAIRPLSIYNALIKDPQDSQHLRLWISKAALEIQRDAFFSTKNLEERAERSNSFTGLTEEIQGRSDLAFIWHKEGRLSWTPTTLEIYGVCPFQFFASQLLCLEEVPWPDMDTEPRTIGRVVHEILETFYSRAKREGRLPLKDMKGEKEKLLAVAKEIFEHWEGVHYLGNTNLWALYKDEILSCLYRFLEEDQRECQGSGFVPMAFELYFGGQEGIQGKSMPCLRLTLLNGTHVYFSGVIDRIDLHPEEGRLRVLDYKYSKEDRREYLKQQNMGIKSFQVPIYLLVAESYAREKGFDGSSLSILGGFYLLKGPRLQTNENLRMGSHPQEISPGSFLLLTDVEEVIARRRDPQYREFPNFLENLSSTIDRILKDDFQVTPTDKKTCQRCPFSSICRIP